MPGRSLISPLRPIIVWAAMRAARSGSSKTGAVSGVGKNPGPMALQLMPWRDHASAMARVSCMMPPLLAPYGMLSAKARNDWSEAMLMMRPHPCACMAGTSFWARKNGAERLRLICCDQVSSVISMAGWRRFVPAPFTRMEMSPNGRAAASAQRGIAARSVMSATTKSARAPAARNSSTAARSSPSRRAASTTLAPASASVLAIARPIPELPPVIRATRPSRLKSPWRRGCMGSQGRRVYDLPASAGGVVASGSPGK